MSLRPELQQMQISKVFEHSIDTHKTLYRLYKIFEALRVHKMIENN